MRCDLYLCLCRYTLRVSVLHYLQCIQGLIIKHYLRVFINSLRRERGRRINKFKEDNALMSSFLKQLQSAVIIPKFLLFVSLCGQYTGGYKEMSSILADQ
jgi:hypothetical protein